MNRKSVNDIYSNGGLDVKIPDITEFRSGGVLHEIMSLTRHDLQYYTTIWSYLESLSPQHPKYLSGIEAAACQLGHFLFSRILDCSTPYCSNLLDGYSEWFNKMHPSHELIIPNIGDGFDPQYHKSPSVQKADPNLVQLVSGVINWGLLEESPMQRTVIKAEVICTST